MAENVKGITIEFRGDTSQLSKAINQIRNESKSLDKELGYINKALKFNPKSVTLWKQKQDVLNKSVKDTEDRLKELKNMQAQLDEKKVSKNSAEYKELEREISITEGKLKSLRAQVIKTGNARMKALSESLKEVGKKATEAGKALTKRVTAPILAIGGASVKAFTDIQSALNIVTKKTGAMGDELKEMQNIVRDLGKTMPTDFETAATAVGELNTRFGVTGDQLESLSASYIKFAKINDVEINDSIDQTQKALSAFGESIDNAPHLLDTLTRASQLTGASVDKLTEGLIQNGTAFQELGLDIDQSVLLMAELEKSGANSETVMQGLRKALKNATEDGIPLNEALADLQDTILNGKDGMDGLTASYKLFGKSGDQIFGAVKNGTIDFKALGNEVDDTSGTLDRVFNETLTPAEKFQTTLNAIEDAGYELGSAIMQTLAPYIQILSEKVQALTEWWSGLDERTQSLIVKIGLIAAAVGPFLVVLGTLISSVGAIIGAISSFGTALTFISGPIGIVIASIGALVAAGVWLYKNWDKVKAFAISMKDKVVEAWNTIKTSISTAVTNIKTAVTNAFTNLKNTVVNIFNTIKAVATGAWNGIKFAITHPIDAAVLAVRLAIQKIKGFFSNLKLKLPNIKLPHFKLTGKFSLAPPSVPKLSIDWYKSGAIFTRPTVFPNGVGVGDAIGGEAVLPLRKLWEEMDKRFASGTTINVYASPGMDVNALALEVERRLIANEKRRRNVWAY